jgi:dTDP-glucose 4,6-dehydratase
MRHIGDRPGQVSRHTANAAKAKNVLGWQPEVVFEEGLLKTIKWYEDNPSWWSDKIQMRHVPIMTKDGRIEPH